MKTTKKKKCESLIYREGAEMGMFDYIVCEMELPNKPDWVEAGNQFQTKDLNCQMDTYIIHPDGSFSASDWTGEINFYDIHQTDNFSHWIEYKAVIVRGKVQSLSENENRIEAKLSREEEKQINIDYPINDYAKTTIVPEVGEYIFSSNCLFSDEYGYDKQQIVYKNDNQFVTMNDKGRLEVHENYLFGRNYYVSVEEAKEMLASRELSIQERSKAIESILKGKSG